MCNQLPTAGLKEEYSPLTKAYDYDNVIMALEIQSHWYFCGGCQPDFSSDVNLIV